MKKDDDMGFIFKSVFLSFLTNTLILTFSYSSYEFLIFILFGVSFSHETYTYIFM